MMRQWLAKGLLGFVAFAGMGCGDIGRVVLELEFPDEDTALRTRALEVIVRFVDGGRVCQNLWNARPPQGLEDRSIVEYPNPVDIRASRADIGAYQPLSVLVFAFSTVDVEASNPIAGGCVEEVFEPERTTELRFDLQRAP